MKKSYITSMPDHIGAFLKASECFAELGINITRVSYNKAVDTHKLFVDVEGSPQKLAEADERLKEIGYLGVENDNFFSHSQKVYKLLTDSNCRY